MKIIHINKEFLALENTVIALGNFDGVHIAHRALLKKCIEESNSKNIKSSLLIFKNHTKNILLNKKQELITSNEQKYKIFEDMGIDYVYEMDFTEEVMNLSPEEFFYDLLCTKLLVKGIVVGFDYRFGKKAAGNIDLLKDLCTDKMIDLFVVDPVKFEDEIVSSSLIRKLITEGNLEKVSKLLTYEYTLQGKIIHGKHLGNEMGYPTANIALSENYVIPKFGVYDSDILIQGKTFKAATNIGKNPTIENSGIRIESHILDFNQNIYGEKVDLILKRFIRPELKFETIEELFDKIKEDVSIVKERM